MQHAGAQQIQTRGALKRVLTCLNAEIVGERSSDCGANSVELVVASSGAGKALESTFDRRGGPVKLVHACISTRKDLESSLHHDGNRVKLAQTCSAKIDKQFSLLWRCCKACADLFQCGDGRRKFFRRGASPLKLMPACLSTSKNLESCFDQFESPVKLVQACLSAWKDLQRNFLHCGGTVKHARTCFSAEMVGESSFNRGGSTVELV